MNSEFVQHLIRRFTPAELVEFLDIQMEQLIDKFEEKIMDVHYEEVAEEIGFEFDGTD